MPPHIPKGRIGKLRADQINAMSEQLSNTPDFGEAQTPPPVPQRPLASGNFPIFAQLGTLVLPAEDDGKGKGGGDDDDDKGDGDGDGDGSGEDDTQQQPQLYGYKWSEITYSTENNLWNSEQGPRGYNEGQNNPAYCIGLSGTSESTYPNFMDQGVLLFPSTDRVGKPILVFQPPTATPLVFAASLTGGYADPSNEECGLDEIGTYEFTPLKVVGMQQDTGIPLFGVDQDIEPGKAVNLSDLNGGVYGGRVVAPEGECAPEVKPTPVPTGKKVIMHYLGHATPPKDDGDGDGDGGEGGEGGEGKKPVPEPLYGFFVKNDLCVNCCTEEGFHAGADEEEQRSIRQRKNIAREMRR